MMPESQGWLLDANMLVALTLSSHLHHRPAHRALAEHRGRWFTTPLTEGALVRLLLNPVVTGQTFTPGAVLSILQGLRTDPRWSFLADGSSLADPLIDLSVLVGHRQVTDLQLVNLAASAGLVLVSFDVGILESLAPTDRKHVCILRP